MLEWYDFVVFAFLAPVIGARFFPSGDPLSGLLSAFAVFAVGYLMRPIGGVLFGHLGDRLGRKRALQLSMALMAVPTALMAALPTHAQVGVLAPVLLVALRLAQGLSVGGEYAGSMCYLVEAAPPGRRAVYGSLTVLGIAAGLVLASSVVAIANAALSVETMHRWGWRLPFLGGIAIGAIGYWVRRGLVETPAFVAAMEAGRTRRSPVAVLLRDHARAVAAVGGIVTLSAVSFYVVFAWMPTYLSHIVTPPVPHAAWLNVASIALLVAVLPVAGRAADALGAGRVLVAADVAYAIAVVPLFHAIDAGALAALFALAIVHGFANGPTPVALTDLLPTEVRYSGVALGSNLSFAIFGGTAPLVATWLIETTGSLAAPAWYLAAVAVGCAAVTWWATRPARK